jgi:hypothetical protein
VIYFLAIWPTKYLIVHLGCMIWDRFGERVNFAPSGIDRTRHICSKTGRYSNSSLFIDIFFVSFLTIFIPKICNVGIQLSKMVEAPGQLKQQSF